MVQFREPGPLKTFEFCFTVLQYPYRFSFHFAQQNCTNSSYWNRQLYWLSSVFIQMSDSSFIFDPTNLVQCQSKTSPSPVQSLSVNVRRIQPTNSLWLLGPNVRRRSFLPFKTLSFSLYTIYLDCYFIIFAALCTLHGLAKSKATPSDYYNHVGCCWHFFHMTNIWQNY